MEIQLLKLLFDTALFILICLVQLVIYPSFIYYSEQQLKEWHKIYTSKITIVVMPLMLGQLGLYLYDVFDSYSVFNTVIFLLVLINWLSTFLIFVPLHNKIGQEVTTLEVRKQLVQKNWIRTILWTLIFLISLYHYAK